MLDHQREVVRMPWREVTRMSLREEFVQLAKQDGSNRRELCRRFGISPKTRLQVAGAPCAGGGRAVLKTARGGRIAARPAPPKKRYAIDEGRPHLALALLVPPSPRSRRGVQDGAVGATRAGRVTTARGVCIAAWAGPCQSGLGRQPAPRADLRVRYPRRDDFAARAGSAGTSDRTHRRPRAVSRNRTCRFRVRPAARSRRRITVWILR